MQIQSKEVIFLIGISSIIFLIAPLFIMLYVLLYNNKKKKHTEEKLLLQKTYENELLKAQMEVQEQTLKNIAYDLHDNIGQLLSLTTITLSTLNLNDPVNAQEKIDLVDDLTKRSITEIKALSSLLHGEVLISRGLVNAIEFELECIKMSGKFEVSFNKQHFLPIYNDSNKETIIFRLFQEIINNVIKHARAKNIMIDLEQAGDDIKLSIRDDGIGFDVEQALKNKTGLGLHNIQNRSSIINGTAEIKSMPGKGSQITITVPY